MVMRLLDYCSLAGEFAFQVVVLAASVDPGDRAIAGNDAVRVSDALVRQLCTL